MNEKLLILLILLASALLVVKTQNVSPRSSLKNEKSSVQDTTFVATNIYNSSKKFSLNYPSKSCHVEKVDPPYNRLSITCNNGDFQILPETFIGESGDLRTDRANIVLGIIKWKRLRTYYNNSIYASFYNSNIDGLPYYLIVKYNRYLTENEDLAEKIIGSLKVL